MAHRAKASVVIRCFNEERHIGALLERVFRQTVSDMEVIVVDSGSTDGTLAIANSFPTRVLQIRPQDFTFGYSLNQGCRAASGEFLVFASAHVLPVSNQWIECLLAEFADPRVALVYGRQVGEERSKFSELQLFAKQFPAESNRDQRTPFCNNANAAIRRALWEEHPYDEQLSGLEDLAWAKWALDHGHRIAYRGDAGIVHVHEETASRIKGRYMREAIALKRIFPDSHVSFADFVSLLLSNVGMDVLAAFREGVVVSRLWEILVFRTMQYWGTYRGMNYRSALTHELIQHFYYPRSLRRADPPAERGGVPESRYDAPQR